ncbi:glycosyltransferase family 39 protein [Tsukamurella paurometabola]|uniref:Glycosyltransferase family 39 protein n=1 Tax=Tsukamurella paurometabola TaxID=2061 RepID=A0ABS5NJH5_TSUPA|nr:glycosyltransferase family 39 protein [Tsukamurella paurometabola]MBS4104443.1 glycosyltransferase family 39 protein [Tsukamurella paurometabola]
MANTSSNAVGSPAAVVPAWARGPVLAVLAGYAVLFGLTVGRGATTPFNEPYFAAAGTYHPAVTYADQPIGLPLLARIAGVIAPDSLLALRLPAVLLTLAGVLVASLLARELGGGRAAQVLAAVMYGALGVSPGWTELETTSFDPQLWVGIVYLLVLWINRPEWRQRDVLLFGAGLLTALALQVKYLVPVLWVGLVIGLVTLGPRRILTRPALWAGGAVALASTIPALLWQARHGWPQAAMTDYLGAQADVAPLGMVTGSLLAVGPLGVALLPLGIYGLVALRELRPFRFLVAALVIAAAAVVVGKGRPDYVAGLAVVAAIAGLVTAERLAAGLRNRRADVARRSLFGVTAVLRAALPLALGLQRFTEPVGPVRPPFVDAVAQVASQNPGAPLVVETYEAAGKLEYFGPAVGIAPGRVYSPHLGYWYFGPPRDTATVLYLGRSSAVPDAVRTTFGTVERIADVPGDDTVGDTTLWRLTGALRPWSAVWPDLNELARK